MQGKRPEQEQCAAPSHWRARPCAQCQGGHGDWRKLGVPNVEVFPLGGSKDLALVTEMISVVQGRSTESEKGDHSLDIIGHGKNREY